MVAASYLLVFWHHTKKAATKVKEHRLSERHKGGRDKRWRRTIVLSNSNGKINRTQTDAK